MGTRQVTIYDVAKKANTSATTVSRVLNNKEYPVRADLRNRVLEAAEELGYYPNMVARNLKYSNTKDIGVIVPNITNPFYSSVILGVEQEASRNGYNVLLCNTLRDAQRELEYIQTLHSKQVKGIVMSSMNQSSKWALEFIERGIEFVFIDQKVEDVDCNIINFDSQKGAYMATEYLIKSGHAKIAFISTPITRWTRKEVYRGYKKALDDYSISYREEYTLISANEVESEGGFEFATGKHLADIFIKSQLDATAVMSINDMTAYGFIQQMGKYGIKVPEDISVVGFDDIPLTEMFTPNLTTISYPSYEVGKLSVKLLLEKLQNPDSIGLNINLEPKLVIRDSVRVIKRE